MKRTKRTLVCVAAIMLLVSGCGPATVPDAVQSAVQQVTIDASSPKAVVR